MGQTLTKWPITGLWCQPKWTLDTIHPIFQHNIELHCSSLSLDFLLSRITVKAEKNIHRTKIQEKIKHSPDIFA